VDKSDGICSVMSPPSTSMSKRCITVKYVVSSNAVHLTAIIYDAGNSNMSHEVMFSADEKIKHIRLPPMPAHFALNFQAKRIVISSDTTEYATINNVKLSQCDLTGT